MQRIGVVQKKIVLLGQRGESTRAIHSALRCRFSEVSVILEHSPSFASKLRWRIRQLGPVRALGQALFRLIQPMLMFPQKYQRQRLMAALRRDYPGAIDNFVEVGSVNSNEARRLLRELRPDVVVVSGTRIIGEKTLRCAPAFVNMHAGITPRYRGVHGGYWAMVNGDAGNFGVTIHLVDRGVDTGLVLRQARCVPTRNDGYSTYPLVQLALGLPLLVEAVESVVGEEVSFAGGQTGIPTGPTGSTQWYHPTLAQYLMGGLKRGIW